MVNSLLPTWMQDLEELKETVSRRPHCGSLDVQQMAHGYTPLVARIEWCRRQREQARTQAEEEEWCAEKEGLRDALLNRDRTYQYRCSPSSVLERYAMGLDDGRLMIRVARRDGIRQPTAKGKHL